MDPDGEWRQEKEGMKRWPRARKQCHSLTRHSLSLGPQIQMFCLVCSYWAYELPGQARGQDLTRPFVLRNKLHSDRGKTHQGMRTSMSG